MTHLIETERLKLRAPNAGDAPRIAEYLNNFEVSGNLSRVPHPYTIDHAHDWLAQWRADAPPAETGFMIDLRGEGAIGQIGYHLRDGNPVIGYWLGEPFWGRGIMTEALTAVLQWYFDLTDEDVVNSGIFHFNMPSLAIQQKLGFVETGRSSVHCLARGEDVEHIDTELTRDTFELMAARASASLNTRYTYLSQEKTAT